MRVGSGAAKLRGAEGIVYAIKEPFITSIGYKRRAPRPAVNGADTDSVQV